MTKQTAGQMQKRSAQQAGISAALALLTLVNAVQAQKPADPDALRPIGTIGKGMTVLKAGEEGGSAINGSRRVGQGRTAEPAISAYTLTNDDI